MPAIAASALHEPILSWYAREARDLPWREPGTSPWAVLVSEVMLQQTPVKRVEPIWRQWMARWPTPDSLAESAPGDAVHAWDRLGYPRRALRLHAAAVAIVQHHDGFVPDTVRDLLALPGVGTYTAAAVSAFAFGQRTTVVDTNVRRVFARVVDGVAQATPSLTRAEMDLATALLPEAAGDARTWNVAVMELGAVVCLARSPRCQDCPVQDLCAWQPARGVVWMQTRNPNHALRMAKRNDGRLVARGVAGGYLMSFEFRQSLAWAIRLMRRYTTEETAANEALGRTICPETGLSAVEERK